MRSRWPADADAAPGHGRARPRGPGPRRTLDRQRPAATRRRPDHEPTSSAPACLGPGRRPRAAPAACAAPRPWPTAHAPTATDQVARGKYLVNTSGCHDCHTPCQDGRQRPRAGHEPHALGPPAGTEDAAGAAAAGGAVAGGRRGHQHRLGRTLGRELHRQPDARQGHRPRAGRRRTSSSTIRTGRHMGRGRGSCRRCRSRSTRTSPMPTWRPSSPTCARSRPISNQVPEPWAPATVTSK